MKKTLLIILSLCVSGVLAKAADEAKKPRPLPADRSKLIEKYDKNGDGKLDDAERAAMRELLKKDREARRKELIAKYDKNGDGKLDADERAAAKSELRKNGKRAVKASKNEEEKK